MAKTDEIPIPHGFTVRESETEIVVEFPYDAQLVPLFRKLPSAKFDRARGAWIVSRRYRKAAVKVLGWIKEARDMARAREIEALNEKGRADAEALEAMHAAGQMSTAHVKVRSTESILRVYFDYSTDAVAAVKRVPGARFDPKSRVWTVPVAEHEALRAAIPAVDAAIAAVKSAKAMEIKQRQASRERQHENRVIVLDRERPGVGQAIRKFGRVLIVQSFGKSFRAPDDLSSFGYIGYEDEIVCYAYCREASADEIAALEAVEAAERDLAARQKAARAAVAAVEAAMNKTGATPSLEKWPEGETIWHDGKRFEIYGGGTKWVLAGDTLWRLRGNGADGDDWSLNNLPSTIASSMPAMPAHVSALREAAEILVN